MFRSKPSPPTNPPPDHHIVKHPFYSSPSKLPKKQPSLHIFPDPYPSSSTKKSNDDNQRERREERRERREKEKGRTHTAIQPFITKQTNVGYLGVMRSTVSYEICEICVHLSIVIYYDARILLFGRLSHIQYLILIGNDTCPILLDTCWICFMVNGHDFDLMDTRIPHLGYTYPAFRIDLHFQKR